MRFFETLLKMVLTRMGLEVVESDGGGKPVAAPVRNVAAETRRPDQPTSAPPKGPLPTPPSKYTIVVAALNGDDEGQSVQAQLVRQLSLLLDCEARAEPNRVAMQLNEDAYAALIATHAQAEQYRLDGMHDVIIWGSVDTQSELISLYLSHENGLNPNRQARSLVPLRVPVSRLQENATTLRAWAISALLATLGSDAADDKKRLAEKLNQLMKDQYTGLSQRLTGPDAQQTCEELISAAISYAGNALDLAQEGVPDHLSEALGLINICAALTPPEDQPILTGCGHAVRGELCLRVQSVYSDRDIAATSQESLKTALEKLSRFPAAATLCAMLHHGLGCALCSRAAETEDRDMLMEAISAFKKASSGINVQQYPLQWSQIMAELGNALLKLGEFLKEGDPINQAVLVFQGVLRAISRNERTIEWARAQFSLAMALFTLGQMEKNSEHIFNARIAFNEAASSFQEADSKRSARMAHNYAEKAQQMLEEHKDIIKAGEL